MKQEGSKGAGCWSSRDNSHLGGSREALQCIVVEEKKVSQAMKGEADTEWFAKLIVIVKIQNVFSQI